MTRPPPAPARRAQGELTPRQKEVLELLAAGRSRREIAFELDLCDETVRSHRYHIYRKLGVHSQAELIVKVAEARAVAPAGAAS